MTDTEGHDYIVAQGASRLLAEGRLRMYLFEMHGVGLSEHATFMWRNGYQCFFILRPRAWRGKQLPLDRFFHCMNGMCWRPWMANVQGWKNAVCVHVKETKMLDWILKLAIGSGKHNKRRRPKPAKKQQPEADERGKITPPVAVGGSGGEGDGANDEKTQKEMDHVQKIVSTAGSDVPLQQLTDSNIKQEELIEDLRRQLKAAVAATDALK